MIRTLQQKVVALQQADAAELKKYMTGDELSGIPGAAGISAEG